MTTARLPRSLPQANGTLMARKINKCLGGCRPAYSALLLACVNVVERVTRIELALSAWEADVLPLNYTRTVSPPWSRVRGDRDTGQPG
jgi:hypothetical protein